MSDYLLEAWRNERTLLKPNKLQNVWFCGSLCAFWRLSFGFLIQLFHYRWFCLVYQNCDAFFIHKPRSNSVPDGKSFWLPLIITNVVWICYISKFRKETTKFQLFGYGGHISNRSIPILGSLISYCVDYSYKAFHGNWFNNLLVSLETGHF